MNADNTAKTNDVIESIIFSPYNAKIPPVAASGYRISKVMYKVSITSGVKTSVKDNAYMELPQISSSALQEPQKLAAFIPHFVSYLESIQDSIVKKYHKDDVSRVSVNSFDLDHILDHLELEGISGRLTSEVVKEWFSDTLEDKLTNAFFTKLDVSENEATEDQLEKVIMIIDMYKKKLVSLSSGRVRFGDDDIEKLMKVLELVGNDDITGNRIKSRLMKMSEADDDLLLESL